jgi:hypothetical protein
LYVAELMQAETAGLELAAGDETLRESKSPTR